MKLIVPNLTVLSIFLFYFSVNCDIKNNKETTIKDSLRNNTNSRVKYEATNENTNSGEQGNILKYEAQKLLKPCGVDKNNDSYDNEFHRRNGNNNNNYQNIKHKYRNSGNVYSGSYKGNKNGELYGNAGDEDEDEEWGSNRAGFSRYSPYPQQNYGQMSNKNYRFPSNQDQDQTNNYYPYRANNQNHGSYGQGQPHNRDSGNNHQQGYGLWFSGSPGRGHEPSGSNSFDVRKLHNGYNTNEDCPDNRGNMFGGFAIQPNNRRYRSSYFREDSRNDEENDDNQCVSQCVFGYMHLIDEDRSPSETLIIKWLQEHVAENDMERIKALRHVRKCFAMLTSTEPGKGVEGQSTTVLTKDGL
ncbi:probable ATP-dependent RNA helicase ddx42 isoform X2 [Euwallacea fornicatus]|uniref:probable ATP-dependent RNA helicase ddx42 isoform X2 n=1 Tax=Euwallacea fornicatus TaxID=995702 RepID=UPI00338F7D7D